MTLTTAIPTNSWNGNGLTTPDEPDILIGVVTDLQTAFGGNLNLNVAVPSSMSTPQGQLAESITQIKGETNDNLRFLANQVNPKYASGIFQDALAWLYFLTRKPALPTSVRVVCSGLDGTVIPVGAKVQDLAGNIYQSVGTGTISAGTVTVTFSNVVNGAIPCDVNTVNKIYQTVVGWDSCNNPTAGTVGADVESQQDFEFRRFNSVANNAHGTLASIYAAVFGVKNVIDVYAYENYTGATQVIDGYSVVEHSIYIAVVGGDDTEIAIAIATKKDVGADMNGNTSVDVKDMSYSYPQPTYTIKFNRPTSLPIYFRVQLVNDPMLPANYSDLIKSAIVVSFNGQDGLPRARIGATVLANRYLANIVKSVVNAQVLDIDVSLNGIAWTNSVYAGIDKTPTLSTANITITLV
jgi:uncharacterized phage protein gp47/JayE